MSAKVSFYWRAHGDSSKVAVVKPKYVERVWEDGSRSYTGKAVFTLPAGREYRLSLSFTLPAALSMLAVDMADDEDSAPLPAGAQLPGLLIDVNGHIHPVSKVSKGDGVKSGEFSLRNWTHRQVIHTTLFTASASLAEWAPSARMVKVNAPTLTLADLVTALPTPAPNGAQPVPA